MCRWQVIIKGENRHFAVRWLFPIRSVSRGARSSVVYRAWTAGTWTETLLAIRRGQTGFQEDSGEEWGRGEMNECGATSQLLEEPRLIRRASGHWGDCLSFLPRHFVRWFAVRSDAFISLIRNTLMYPWTSLWRRWFYPFPRTNEELWLYIKTHFQLSRWLSSRVHLK